MCKDCGCEDALHHHHHHHPHEHEHEHPHVHESEIIPLEQAVLAENDRAAEENRAWFHARGIRVFNLISSPGSGKTSLLVETLKRLKTEGFPAAVIVGDQYGELDAERLRATGCPSTQIQVRESCHLTASQIAAVREAAVPAGTKILFIENVGNLVCPTAFDLGEDEKVALLSTPEGEEKPLKYPALFSLSHFILLTKCDLAEVLGWDRALCRKNIRTVHPDARILEISVRTGAGMDSWIDFLKQTI